MYLQTGDEGQWLKHERRSLGSKVAGRGVTTSAAGKSRWTRRQAATCMDLGAAIGLAVGMAAGWARRLNRMGPTG